jgi:hypothetical protein
MKLKFILSSVLAVTAICAMSGVAFAGIDCPPNFCNCVGQNGSKCCGANMCSSGADGNCTCG